MYPNPFPLPKHITKPREEQKRNQNIPKKKKKKSMKEVKRMKALGNKKTVGFYLLEGLAMGEEEE